MSQEVNAFLGIVRDAWARTNNANLSSLRAAADKRKRGTLHIKTCKHCGYQAHHDVWRELCDDGVEREHTRCHACNTISVY